MLHDEKPKIRPDSAITHSEAGGLSTVMELRGVERAEEQRLPVLRPGLHRGGVEALAQPEADRFHR